MKPVLRKSLVALGVAALFSTGAFAAATEPALAAADAGQPLPLPPRMARAGELLIKYKATVSDAVRQKKHQDKGHVKLKEFKSVKVDRIKLQPGQSLLEGIRAYKGDPDIEYAEPNYVMSSQLIPNEPVFTNGSQWALDNPGTLFGVAGIDIRAKLAWDITIGSPQVVVAVIDSGIDRTHQDMGLNLWVNTAEQGGLPGVDDDGNGFVDDVYGIDTINLDSDPQDDNGHGTKAASIIGANTNTTPALGMAGLAWNVKLLACKAGDALGSIPIDATISCLDYIKTMKSRGVNIIATNNSYGAIGAFSQAMRDAIDAQRDILYIAAAGNFGIDNDVPGTSFYPASYDLPNVISVAATNPTDNKPVWSHWGRRTVHLGAPGENIYAADLFNAYSLPSGTSYSAPLVTGVAVLLKAQDPTRDWRALKNLLVSSGSPNASLTGKTISGRRLDALGALSCTNQPVFTALKVAAGAQVGVPTTLSATSINCASAVGPVTATTSTGQVITLTDDGVAPDQAAGDGVFSGTFTPAGSYAFIDFTSPLGTERVGTPDLTVSGISGPAFVDLGAAITVNANVTNAGTVPAGTSTINFYLSSNGLVEPTDTLLGSVAVPAIGAGATTPITAALAVPPAMVSGNYFVVARVDPDNTMIEANEGNNDGASAATVLVGAPPVDLTVASVTAPATGTRGNQINVGATVANTGTLAAPATTVSFYISSDNVITTADTLLGTLPAAAVAGGASVPVSGTLTIPKAVTNGTYYVGAIADSGGAVIETNENNNAGASATTTVVSTAPVDLNISSVSGPRRSVVGGNVTISATLRNLGSATVAAPSVRFYISNNNIIDATDTPLGTVTTTALAGGGSRTVSGTFAIPGTVTAGTRYFGAIADPDDLVVETNENNNIRLGNSTSVSVTVDEVMTAVSGPATAVTGQTINVSGTVRNQGSGAVNLPTKVGFYLSSDATITTNDRFLGSVDVPSLASLASSVVNGSFVIPTNLTPGTYRIGAIADYTNAVRESSETNNALAGNTITIGIGPDLIVQTLTGPATGTAGSPITINATVLNQGLGIAEVMDLAGNKVNTRIGFYLSSDAVITTADTFLGFLSFPNLANGQAVALTFTGTLPSTLRGTYYIGAIADYNNQLVEANESNNAKAGNTIVLTIGGQMILEQAP